EEDLSGFAFKATTTWGDSNDYRHFVPRIIELALIGSKEWPGLDPGLIGRKLRYAGWQSWPIPERQCLERFVLTVWELVLRHPRQDRDDPKLSPVPWDLEDALELIGGAYDDIGPFLRMWWPTESVEQLEARIACG